MAFQITYTACQSPQGNQNPLNLLKYNPRVQCWSGDYVYNDSLSVTTYNGYTMNPSVFWNTQTDGAPIANANIAAYTLTRFEKHYGRTGLAPYAAYWAESDKRGVGTLLNFFQPDDHDHTCNNYDHSLLVAQAGFPFTGLDGGTGLNNNIYGQVSGVQNQAQNLAYIWRVRGAGFNLLRKATGGAYADNPISPGYNGNVPNEMLGVATPFDYPIEYFYKDFGSNGELGGNCVRLIFTDSISYKHKALDADTAAKQFWGSIQEEWLYQTALDAKTRGYAMVIFISTKDLYNLDNNDGPWTYSTRRDALLLRLHQADIPHFWMCGDKHVPHVGMARVANGKSYDALGVCATPFGQGIGNLTQYTENIWFASKNDQCVFGMVQIDDYSRCCNIYIIDAWDNQPVWSCRLPFFSRIPDKIWARPYPAFIPSINPDRTVITVGASPQTYQNTTNRVQLINVEGGTFTAVDYSEDNFTTSESIAITQRQFIVRPGDYIKFTFPVTPPTKISSYSL